MNGDHLYILCGTNSNTYNTDVFDVYLPTMTSEQIGFTFIEPEGPGNSGRCSFKETVFSSFAFLI